MNRTDVVLLSLSLVGFSLMSQPMNPHALAQGSPMEPSLRHAAVPWRPIGRDAFPGVTLDPSLRQSYERKRDESVAQAHDRLIERHAEEVRLARTAPPGLLQPPAPEVHSSIGSSSAAR